MNDLLEDIRASLKRGVEKRKKIREEMSKVARIFDSITLILGLFFIIFFILSDFGIGIFEIDFKLIFLILIIVVPIGLIDSRINKKALEEYRAKLKKQRLNYCPYCAGELHSLQKFCPFCGKELKESIRMKSKTRKFEKNLREKIHKGERKKVIPSESAEIYSISRKGIYITMVVSFVVVSIVLPMFFGVLFGDFSLFLPFFTGFLFIPLIVLFISGYVLSAGFIYSRFIISRQIIQLYIEDKLFFQVSWSEIERIDVYRVRFRGYYVKINYSGKFKLIRLNYCDFPKKKQKKIVNTFFAYAEEFGKKRALMKTATPILDDLGEKELYEEIYQFARAQRFIFHKSRS